MRLTSIRLRNVGPFDDVTIPFVDEGGMPRRTTVILGDSGAGKTTLLSAIACTRPGLVLSPPRAREAMPAFAVATYRLGDDDPQRPHDLVVASPNAQLDEAPNETTARKREQAHFDRLAGERGFCLVPFSALRWAARVPSTGATPDRPISALDHRGHATFDDAARADLARESKQALVNAVTVAALEAYQADRVPVRASAAGVEVYRSVFGELLPDDEAVWEGLDPNSYEPLFRDAAGRVVPFDDLASGIKARILIGTILVRRLSLAYPGKDPREAEGIVLIDEIEAHLPQRREREIVDALAGAFPRLQWIVTTQSSVVVEARPHDEIVVLSRDLETGAIAVAAGPTAVLH
jgi:predicted ATPase